MEVLWKEADVVLLPSCGFGAWSPKNVNSLIYILQLSSSIRSPSPYLWHRIASNSRAHMNSSDKA